MSVRTEMTDLRESLSINVRKAIEDLDKILDPNTWGYHDMSDEWINGMIDIQVKLRKIERII